MLGALIFSEVLPKLWWLGAAFLVAGSVIIGRREEGKEVGSVGTAGEEPAVGTGALSTGVVDGREEEGTVPGERFTDDPADVRESVELRTTEERER